MAHQRDRLALQKLLKRLKFSPIVALQGARQTGKSVLARELLQNEVKNTKYVTLDQLFYLTLCRDTPETFLSDRTAKELFIIDEAQKAPALFDALKLEVDKNRVPGQFLILGSTEFSHLQNIRENLTGRLSRVRVFPMNFRELSEQYKGSIKINRSLLMKYSETGGMPGIAFIRDSQVRTELLEDWVKLTCERDIHQFKRLKLDSDLAFSIFKAVSLLEEPTLANISRTCRANAKKVQSHVKALIDLFCLFKLSPHPSGSGKEIFLPLDAGIAFYFGASITRRLHIILVNERMIHNQYFDSKNHLFYYYRSTGKNHIHLIEESLDSKISAFQIFDTERVQKIDLQLLKAFKGKNSAATLTLFAPIRHGSRIEKIQVKPWEEIVI